MNSYISAIDKMEHLTFHKKKIKIRKLEQLVSSFYFQEGLLINSSSSFFSLSPNESVKLFKKCAKSLLGKKHFFLWCPSLVLLNYNELALRKQKFFLEQMNNFVSLYLQHSFPSNLCCASFSAVFLLVIRTLQDLLLLW